MGGFPGGALGGALKRIVKLAVSAGLLYYLASTVDLKEILRIAGQARPGLLLASVLAGILNIVLTAWRWQRMTKGRMKLPEALSYTFIGCFFNCFLPTSFGGDGVRVLYYRRHARGLRDAFASVFWDRYTGFCGLILVGGVGYIAGFALMSATPLAWVYPVLLAATAASLPLIRMVPWGRFLAVLRHDPSEQPGAAILLEALGISLLIQTVGILCVYLLALSLQLNVTALECFVFLPLGTLVTMLPVSISGIGVREGALVYLFGLAGVPAHEALTLSLGWFAITLLLGVIGSVEYLRRGKADEVS
jgi:uncharacterized membrane protein YbhN (UPF0104 family)